MLPGAGFLPAIHGGKEGNKYETFGNDPHGMVINFFGQ
jgi:hypothetical protein